MNKMSDQPKSELLPSPKQVAELSTHDLGEALLCLAKELWVTKDRLFIVENVLIDSQQISPDAVSHYQPSDQLKQALAQEREQFLSSILRTLQDRKHT